MATYLRLGPNRTQVDTIEIGAVELNFAIKNIENYGKRNSSFSKPITVLRTKVSDSIFQGLHNINIIDGYDIKQKYYGEITENGIPILIGSLQVVEITPTTYECVLSSNNVSLFADLSGKKIVGNTNSADDLVFTGKLYEHNYDVSTVYQYLNTLPPDNGKGLMYPIIDYNNRINVITDIEYDYPMMPAIAVRQLFDKIITNSGYTYTLSSDISTQINKMYIPFNGILNNGAGTASDVSYGYYFLGNPTDYTFTFSSGLTLDPSSYFNPVTYEVIPSGCIQGFVFYDAGHPSPPIRPGCSGGYDTLYNRTWNYRHTGTDIGLPTAGTYVIDVSIQLYNSGNSEANRDLVSLNWTSWNDEQQHQGDVIEEEIDVDPTGYYNISKQIEVTVVKPSTFRIYMFSNRFPFEQIINRKVQIIFGQWTGLGVPGQSSLRMTLKNYAYAKTAPVNLNVIRPQNYNQSDLVNDVLKMFNAYIEVDPYDEHKLVINSYSYFYVGGTTIDWTLKLDADSVKFKSIKNEFLNQSFLYSTDTDLYNVDFDSKYPIPLGSKNVLNDSEFVEDTNEIKLSVASTAMKTFGYGIDWPVIVDKNGVWKNTWKPRILYSNSNSVGINYGIDPHVLSYWNSLNHKDASDNSLKWDTQHTYINTPTETNETIYNQYYRDDVESNLDDTSYLLTAKFALNANDIYNLSFRNIIQVNHPTIGEGFFRINQIKNYKPNQLTEVELIKITIPISSYAPTISTLVSFLTTTGTAASGGSSGGSSGSGTGGATALSALTDVLLTSPIEKDVLTYDDVLGKWINEPGSGGINNFENLQDVSVAGRADKDAIMFVEDASKWKNYPTINIGSVFVKRAGDTMYGALNMINDARIYADYIDSSMPFLSGFAGQGYQLAKAINDDYNLTVDNLTVRKMMRVYELQINKISAVNGGIMVSVANGKAYAVNGNDIIFDEDNGHELIQFAVDDYIRAQEWTGRGVDYYLGKVLGVTHSNTLGSAYITVQHISGTPWEGAELVQVGNLTDTARQSMIYITAADNNNPYIDMLSGVTDGQFAGHNRCRLGNLTGITDAAFGGALSGYGLYSDNIYLKGKIVISAGSGYANISDKPTTLAGVNATEGAKLTGIAAGATVGATWGVGGNITNQPGYVGPPSGTGLFIDGTKLGYYTAGAWKTYIDNAGNMLMGNYSGGGGLYWDQTNGVLNIKGSISITNTIPYASVAGTPTTLNAVEAGTGTKLAGIATGATVGATWGSNLYSVPARFGDSPTTGLVITSSYMGYYDGAAWKSYIDNTGKAKFVDVVEFGTEAVAGPWSSAQNIAVRASDIWENMGQTSDSAIHINRFGRGGSQDPGAAGNYQRNFYVYDGRGNARIQCEGGGTTFNQAVAITNQGSFGSFVDTTSRQFSYSGQFIRSYYIATGATSHTIGKTSSYTTQASVIILQTTCSEDQWIYLPGAADGETVTRGTEIIFINQSAKHYTIIGKRSDAGQTGYPINNAGSVVNELTLTDYKSYSVIFGGQYWCDAGGYR